MDRKEKRLKERRDRKKGKENFREDFKKRKENLGERELNYFFKVEEREERRGRVYFF